jgi:hypothetical protein
MNENLSSEWRYGLTCIKYMILKIVLQSKVKSQASKGAQ